MLTNTAKPQVTFDNFRKIPGPGAKHLFIDATIIGLTEKNASVSFEVGSLGVTRVFAIVPTPLGEHMSVVWNGNVSNPTLSFDGWGDKVKVLLEVWGS